MHIICLLLELYQPEDNEFAIKNTIEDTQFVFAKNMVVDHVSEYDTYSIMLPDGRIHPIDPDIPISSVFQPENIEKMVSFILEKMKEEIIPVEEYLKNKKNERDQLRHEINKDPKKKIEYLQCCMEITSIYMITDHKIDEMKEDKKVEQDIMNSIVKERKKEVEEEESEIRNELDMLNSILRETFPEQCNELNIESCTYNGEDIDTNDMVEKLLSHMLPNFITQIDIRETLDDEYQIVTNLGIIIREKGGEIRIVEK